MDQRENTPAPGQEMSNENTRSQQWKPDQQYIPTNLKGNQNKCTAR